MCVCVCGMSGCVCVCGEGVSGCLENVVTVSVMMTALVLALYPCLSYLTTRRENYKQEDNVAKSIHPQINTDCTLSFPGLGTLTSKWVSFKRISSRANRTKIANIKTQQLLAQWFISS